MTSSKPIAARFYPKCHPSKSWPDCYVCKKPFDGTRDAIAYFVPGEPDPDEADVPVNFHVMSARMVLSCATCVPEMDLSQTSIFAKRRTYTIPFRPEYLLVEGEPTDPRSLVSAAQPLGRNVSGFRFHLSPEAIALIRAEDPGVSPIGGYCAITIKFNSDESGPAVIEATRVVLPTAAPVG